MMDAVTKNGVAAGILRLVQLYTLVSALQAANAELRPGSSYALPGPLRPRKKSSVALLVDLALQGEGGIGDTYQGLGGYAASSATLTLRRSLAGQLSPACADAHLFCSEATQRPALV